MCHFDRGQVIKEWCFESVFGYISTFCQKRGFWKGVYFYLLLTDMWVLLTVKGVELTVVGLDLIDKFD
ncbi:hypothetical protein Barb4_02451 [Bacteroidales bacterium Barb4]|nr:hypothetical protein Barb4_02451 [Bacteroidales bacterium Barb4]